LGDALLSESVLAPTRGSRGSSCCPSSAASPYSLGFAALNGIREARSSTPARCAAAASSRRAAGPPRRGAVVAGRAGVRADGPLTVDRADAVAADGVAFVFRPAVRAGGLGAPRLPPPLPFELDDPRFFVGTKTLRLTLSGRQPRTGCKAHATRSRRHRRAHDLAAPNSLAHAIAELANFAPSLRKACNRAPANVRYESC
jgi:hypothetical protein